MKISQKPYSFEKVGVNEVVGLKKAMLKAFEPIVKTLKEKMYWNNNILEWAEYKSRDGFIPHSDNGGGILINQIIPSCEQYEFGFLEFGECDDEECIKNHEHHCAYEDDGHLDAKLRIWFKFEGIVDGKLSFYLVVSGSNLDAPYFRESYQPTLFEAEFSCHSVDQVERAANQAIKKLVKFLE